MKMILIKIFNRIAVRASKINTLITNENFKITFSLKEIKVCASNTCFLDWLVGLHFFHIYRLYYAKFKIHFNT